MARVTIMDVARAAGVSKGAASHALNDMPGVSEETRARVKAAAAELDWTPNSTARALSGSRAGAIGWAILRTQKSSSVDPYFMEMFAGVELELAGTDLALVVKLVGSREEEAALYRRWGAERRVDGVLLLDFDDDDPRLALLAELGLPAAAFRSFLGEPGADDGAATIWSDERAGLAVLLGEVFSRGHRRVVWVSGDERLRAIRLRAVAAEEIAAHSGAVLDTVFTDFSPEQGSLAVREVMARAEPPTCIVFDNDLMALAGLATLTELGRRVPADVSMLSLIDSSLCVVSSPPIAALKHPTTEFGRLLTRRLLDLLDGAPGTDPVVPPLDFVARASLSRVAP